MGKFNEELVKAGVMLGGRGAAPQLEGRAGQVQRQQADRHRRAVRRDEGAGRRLLAWQVKSREEAIEWVKRCPIPTTRSEVEIRQVFEAEDFGAQPSCGQEDATRKLAERHAKKAKRRRRAAPPKQPATRACESTRAGRSGCAADRRWCDR